MFRETQKQVLSKLELLTPDPIFFFFFYVGDEATGKYKEK